MREEAKEFLKNLNIAVIGLGLMGGSFAKRLRERTKCRITAFDCEAETLNKALADGVIDAGYTEGNEELKKADLLIVCLSRDNMLSFLRQNAVYLRERQTLTDIIGIKGNSVE
ncbi:MAG: prephenate dehydrogenase/arogenate dehydrogenase family protein, partial [Megasphaera micronuciformis]|nr:prephenate dehydrogenase/arogenate dehydrogenase family protein [Megasphaera micronuciformis]